ncbi:MAG TPA: hypothetical protein VG963_11490, partial [Polyangiaceae bacterium]|nr:hypothetical protein [Polyangiaceae bacterium]
MSLLRQHQQRSGAASPGIFHWAAALIVLLGVVCSGRVAHAQRTFYLDRIQVGGSPDDGLATRRVYMAPQTRVYASTTLGYVIDALRASTVAANAETENKIENLIQQQLISYFN